jgi:hypothetical protein
MAGVVDKSVFAKASSIKDALSKKEAKEVADLYKDWAGQIGELADYYDKKPVPSAAIQSQYYQQLKNQVTEWSKQVTSGVYDKAGKSMNIVADAVVADNAKWMSGFGFSDKAIDAAFSNIPQSTVNALLTGSVYGGTGSWSLSKAIWGDNQDTLKHVYQIVAQGAVMQMPTGDIARKLEQYVNPDKQFKWNGPDGYPPIYGKKVDYNAQRLVRTLTQHTYQQSIVATAKSNPLIEKIRWVSNGSRVCPLCMERDGKVFSITNVPLDHPNGMCVLEPVVNWDKLDELADWVNEPDGTYPWWDNKMQAFGYKKGGMPKSSIISNMKKVEKAASKIENKVANVQDDYKLWSEDVLSKIKDVHNYDDLKDTVGEDAAKAYINFYKMHKKELKDQGFNFVQDLVEGHLNGDLYGKIDAAELDSMLASKFPGLKIGSIEGSAEEVVKKVAEKAAVKAEAAAESEKAKLPSFNKIKAELAEKKKQAQQVVKEFEDKLMSKGKLGEGKVQLNYIKKFDKLLGEGYNADGALQKIIGGKEKYWHQQYLYNDMFQKLTGFSYLPSDWSEEDAEAVAKAYFKLTGNEIKKNAAGEIDYFYAEKFKSKLVEAFMNGDKKTLAKLGIGDDVIDEAIEVFTSKYYYGFNPMEAKWYKDALAALDDANDAYKTFSKTGVLGDIVSDKADEIAKKAAKKAAEEAEAAAKELAEKQAKAAEKLKSFKGAFKQDAYTDEAKKAAKKFANRREADEFYRKGLDKTWEELTEDQKFAVWKYTENSNPMNKVLSGYANGSWNRNDFVGVGKANWHTEDDWRTLSTSAFKKKFGKDAYGHIDHAKAISDLTTAIDHTVSKQGMHLRRGSDTNGLAGLLEGDLFSFDQAKSLCKKSQSEMQKALVGQVFDNHSFMSTGISEDAGFEGNVSYSIYAPKGTRYIYAEPQSYYGNTVGEEEKIYKAGQSYSSVGSEAEIILQRGTSFRITNVKKFGSDIHIDMEVVAQPDYFKTGYEQTIDGGATVFKH